MLKVSRYDLPRKNFFKMKNKLNYKQSDTI